MNPANEALLEAAADHLGELLSEVVFVGGATVELWLTDPAAPEFRPTKDVDVIVEISTRTSFYRFEERLREQRFEHDQESGVLCRFQHPDTGLLLDVMPTDGSILGFENHWQGEAFPHAVDRDLASGGTVRAIPPTYLLATKIEAFHSRGNGDFYGSRDFQDIVALIDGRSELPEEMALAPRPLRQFVSDELASLTQDRSFGEGIQGALLPGPETQERARLVIAPRIEQVIGAGRTDQTEGLR